MTGLGSSVASTLSMEFKDSHELASNSEPVHLAFDCHQSQETSEGKTPVIFLHGITASKEYWYDIPKIVADKTKRKVYVVDLRHHGDSPWSKNFEFDSNGLDLLHFMDTHRIDKAILVGHSMGGMIAIKFALEKPQRIEMLVVEDATIGKIPEEAIAFLKYMLIIAKDSITEIPGHLDDSNAHELLPKIMTEKIHEFLREFAACDKTTFVLKKENGKFTFKANIRAIESLLDSLPSTIPEPEGLTYSGLTCFIYGENSPFDVGSDKDNIRRYFPCAELVGVENAGHTIHKECPSEFLDALLKFLCKAYVARL